MDRRKFLSLMVGGVAAAAAARTFRNVASTRWMAADWGFDATEWIELVVIPDRVGFVSNRSYRIEQPKFRPMVAQLFNPDDWPLTTDH